MQGKVDITGTEVDEPCAFVSSFFLRVSLDFFTGSGEYSNSFFVGPCLDSESLI